MSMPRTACTGPDDVRKDLTRSRRQTLAVVGGELVERMCSPFPGSGVGKTTRGTSWPRHGSEAQERVARPFRTARAVTVSFVLRLLDDHLRPGEVVGQAETVQTGERHVVADVIELVSRPAEARPSETPTGKISSTNSPSALAIGGRAIKTA